MVPVIPADSQSIELSLHPVRQVFEADVSSGTEAPPLLAEDGLLPGDFQEAIWYVTGKRDGVAMCNVLFYHWDPVDHVWIELGPQRPVVEGGILSQRTFGERVAIRLKDIRGDWSIKVKAASGTTMSRGGRVEQS